MNRHPVSQPSWLGFLIVLGLAAIFLCSARHLVHHALPNSDEGFYAYVSQDVMHGRQPYRDFAYTQTPVLPYLQGAVMSVVGFGVREERWINSACGLAALLLAVFLWRAHGLDWLNCTALVVVWCLCISLIYYTVIGKTYAWAELWLMIAAAALCLRARPWTALVLFSVAGVLAIGCRLTTAPAVAVLWFGLVVLHRERLSAPMFIALPLLAAVAVLGPFIAADPDNAYFWVIQYHLLSAIPPQRLAILWLSVRMAPVIALLGVAGLFQAQRRWREPGSWLLLAGLAGWLAATLGPGVYADYAAPCFPLVLAGTGCLLAQVRFADSRMRWGLPVLLAGLAVGGLFIKAEDYFFEGYLEAIDHTTDFVRAHTQPGDFVLTPVPETVVGTGRRVLPGLELGKFGVTAEMTDQTASRRHILTMDQLIQTVKNRTAPVVVLSRFRGGNFLWSVPSLVWFNRQTRLELFTQILQGYDCTYTDDFFLVFERKGPDRKTHPVDPAAL